MERREPAEIGRWMEDALTTSAQQIVTAFTRAQEKARSASTDAGRRLAREEERALERLHAEPFFGWMQLEEDGKPRELRIAREHHAGLRIVSWKHPLARLFYGQPIGEVYDREGGADLIEGVVQAKARLSTQQRALHHVLWEDQQGALELERGPDAAFILTGGVDIAAAAPVQQRSPEGLREISAYLTAQQYEMVSRASNSPLIIQGRAGSGKTTVALHRLSWLTTADEQGAREVAPERTLIVMFNRALCSFVDTMLRPLGLEQATVKTFHQWALETVKRAYRGRLEITTARRAGQAAAHRVKAQLGVVSALERYVEDQAQRASAFLRDKLAPLGALRWAARHDALDGPVLQRLVTLRAEVQAARAAAPYDTGLIEVAEIVQKAVERMSLYKEDLHRVLTDRELLAEHLPRVPRRDLDALVAYQDAMQREGATRRVGPHVDFPDLALLICIIQLKHGGLPISDEEALRYDHLLVDEAQDFGAVELTVLMRAVKTRAGVTIVGDVNQKILPHVDFMGWDALAQELGLGGANVARLTVGHRSSGPIMALADALTEEGSSGGGRQGQPPIDLRCDDDEEVFDAIAAQVDLRLEQHPQAHICVVCHDREAAEQVHAALRRAMPAYGDETVRFGYNDRFTFAPGVSVTTRRQIKGLEFDTVLIHEPTAASYPDSPQGRRDLYVACSRAQERLIFVGRHPRTPLLDALVDQGLARREGASMSASWAEDDDDEAPL